MIKIGQVIDMFQRLILSSLISTVLTHYLAVLPLQTLSVASLKLTASSRPTAPPSGLAKCLRFGHWLTLRTLNIVLT